MKYGVFFIITRFTNTLVKSDLAWHTHMLHHKSYKNFCISRIGRMINHDDTIPEAELNEYVQKTNIAWRSRNESRLPSDSIASTSNPAGKEERKKYNLKGKFQSLLTNKKSHTKSGYLTEMEIFKGAFSTGRYTSSPSYQPQFEAKVDIKASVTNDNVITKKVGEVIQYDTEKVSFHDKSKFYFQIKQYLKILLTYMRKNIVCYKEI